MRSDCGQNGVWDDKRSWTYSSLPGPATAMNFKLMEAAEGRWRRLNGYHLVALVRAGAKLENGQLVEANYEKKVAA